MAETKPVLLDVGARQMGAFFGAYSKKLRNVPGKIAKRIEELAKQYIERGFTPEGRYSQLSRFTMITKERHKTTPLLRSRELINSIEAKELTSDFAVVEVGAPYAAIHEFGQVLDTAKGTTKGKKIRDWYLAQLKETGGLTKPLRERTVKIIIPERPFLRPAFDQAMRELPRFVQKELGPGAPDLRIRIQMVR